MDESSVELLDCQDWSEDRLARHPAQVPQLELWICFPDARCAEFLIAGIPAAARVLQAVAKATSQKPVLCGVAAGEWHVSRRCLDETLRLADCAPFQMLPHGKASADVLIIDGMMVLARMAEDAGAGASPLSGEMGEFQWSESQPQLGNGAHDALLRKASRAFLKATGKREDGLVSRYLNRPVSRSISALLLRFAAIRPLHATAGTALLAIMMLAALVFGGSAGAIAGALLFHAASVFDGVDGEIARATHRTSAAGARLDSLIDAATNLAFLGGLSFNLFSRGQGEAALAGLIGIVVLLVGLWLIGSRSQALGQPINFEAVKVYLRQGRPNSLLTDLLIWLTMRDFIAAACATLVVLGFAAQTLFVFMSGAIVWLISASVILARTSIRAKRSQPTR